MLSTVAVVLETITSGVFLIMLLFSHKWWRSAAATLLLLMTSCLFLLTVTLTVTNTNEGLGTTPLAVTIGRLGFAAVNLAGVAWLTLRPLD